MPNDPQFHPVVHKLDKGRMSLPSDKLSLWEKIKLANQLNNLINTIQTMNLSGSWRSSVFGVGGLATIIFNTASMLLDGNPDTNPDWSVVLPAIMTAAALLFTKDANVSNAPNPTTVAKPVK